MSRRGLTLLEVLAAATLLAVIAAACLPMLAEARRWAAARVDPAPFDALARLADEVTRQPGLFAIDSVSLTQPGALIDLPPAPPLPTTVLRVLESPEDIEPHHTWIEFRAGPHRVLRYIDLPGPKPGERP